MYWHLVDSFECETGTVSGLLHRRSCDFQNPRPAVGFASLQSPKLLDSAFERGILFHRLRFLSLAGLSHALLVAFDA